MMYDNHPALHKGKGGVFTKDYLKRHFIATQPLSFENYDDAQIKTKCS